jgi:hypothetical protein
LNTYTFGSSSQVYYFIATYLYQTWAPPFS